MVSKDSSASIPRKQLVWILGLIALSTILFVIGWLRSARVNQQKHRAHIPKLVRQRPLSIRKRKVERRTLKVARVSRMSRRKPITKVQKMAHMLKLPGAREPRLLLRLAKHRIRK